MLKAGFRQAGESLEAVRTDGGTGYDILGEERHDRRGLEVGNYTHAESTSLATLFDGRQDESRPQPTLGALVAPLLHQFVGPSMPASKANEPIPPATTRQILSGRSPRWQKSD